MNNELGTPLLISLVILIVLIGVVIWWYGVRKGDTKQGVTFKSPGYRDDLTLIDGIGATLQSKLNSLGITSFKQIAELTEQDIEKINEQLAFKGRIEREGWVAQARKLVEAGSRSTAGAARPAPEATAGNDGAGLKGKKRSTKKKAAGKKKTTRKTGKKTTRKAAKKTAKKARSTKR